MYGISIDTPVSYTHLKQWKCQTVESTDWNSRENAKMWRKDLADTINAANEQLEIAVRWAFTCT